MGDFWVFGYGSLIWNPGFEVLERQKANLHGLHRSLCLNSWVHRGTKQNPGLIFGLNTGGMCVGIAMKASGENREPIIEYLRERELVTDVYLEIWADIELEDGTKTKAITYKVDVTHEQYVGTLPINEQLALVSSAKGKSGTNIDYIKNTARALREADIHDAQLEELDAIL